ncbi:MAG: carbohydrate ABC transporter permease [Anaerolineae bacterium]|jgi:multiple sugar transport system permease protein
MALSNAYTPVQANKPLGQKRSLRAMRRVGKIITYSLLVLGGALFTVPFFWMVTTSLKTMGQILTFPPVWIPLPPQWQNYGAALDYLPFMTFVTNTAIVTSLSSFGYIISSSLIAFGFARLRFSGRDFWFMVLLATFMLPGQVTLIPQFLLFQRLGWLNTLLPLIVPSYFGSAFYTFLLRQFMMTLPMELDEAARIDGASSLRIFWTLIVPLAKPALATVAIMAFMHNWNDFFGPLIYLTSPEKMTLAVGLQLFRGRFSTEFNVLMSAATMAILPVFIVFFFTQKTFVEGIALTGIKG